MDNSTQRKGTHFPYRRQQRLPASRWLLLAVFFLLLFSNAALLAAGTAMDAYQRGNTAFRAGDYEQALAAYLAARRAGLDKNTLIYNIGVTNYKLGRYEEARRIFRELLDDMEMAPLACYNLGLTALKLGDEQEARRWFRRTIRESDNARLRAAADAMVARLDKRQPDHKPSWWSGFVTLGGGYDSNVILRSDAETIATSDQTDYFAEIFAYGRGRVSSDRRRGLSLEGSVYLLNYEQLDAYNTSALRVGGVFERRLGQWRLKSGLHYVHTLLDQNGYTRSATLGLRGKRRLNRSLQLRLRYDLSYIDDLDERVAYLQGWRQKIRVGTVWRLDDRKRLRCTYQLELNDREDLDGVRFVSYSPTRHTLRLEGRYKFNPDYTASLDLRYRYSRYNDPTELSNGSTRTREENRTRAALSLSRNLNKGPIISAEYRYTHNASNFRRYDYHRGEFSINLLWPW